MTLPWTEREYLIGREAKLSTLCRSPDCKFFLEKDCNREYQDCVKFGNEVNFQGFPDISTSIKEDANKIIGQLVARKIDQELMDDYKLSFSTSSSSSSSEDNPDVFNYKEMMKSVDLLNSGGYKLIIGIDPAVKGGDKSVALSFRKKKKPESVRPTIYRGYAGVSVVNSYLFGCNWSDDDGLLVCSQEGYFFGIISGRFKGIAYLPIAMKEDGPLIRGSWTGSSTLPLERQAIRTSEYRIEKINFAGQYWNAILVDSLAVAESIPNFLFVTPEMIEDGAKQSYYRTTWDDRNYWFERDSLQSEMSLGVSEYNELLEARRELERMKVEKKKRVEVEKREKKAVAERQLIF